MIPPGGERVERIIRFDERFGLSDEERGRLLRIALMRAEENQPSYVIVLESDDIRSSIRAWGEEKAGLLAATGKPVLKIINIDKAYSLWPAEHTKLVPDKESMAMKDEGGSSSS